MSIRLFLLVSAGLVAAGCGDRAAAPERPPVVTAEAAEVIDSMAGIQRSPLQSADGVFHPPENFGWVVPGALAGLARPGLRHPVDEDLAYLRQQGVGLLVSLTENPINEAAAEAAGIEVLHLPVPDMAAPTQPQIDRFVERAAIVIRSGRAVAVHCLAGLGRTGTLLACYLVFLGMEPAAAMERIRSLRPGSIESREQEQAVIKYGSLTTIQKR